MLIDCLECGNRISDEAKVCPTCGAPVTKKGADIKAHQMFGLVLMASGLGLYLLTANPNWNIVGGVLMVLGFIGALL